MNIILAISSKSVTRDTTFDNYFSNVDASSNIPKLYRMDHITTEEVVDKLDMSQARFGKLDELGSWDMEIIQTDNGMQFTSKEFQEGLFLCGVLLIPC